MKALEQERQNLLQEFQALNQRAEQVKTRLIEIQGIQKYIKEQDEDKEE